MVPGLFDPPYVLPSKSRLIAFSTTSASVNTLHPALLTAETTAAAGATISPVTET